jgi:hypothetical protein
MVTLTYEKKLKEFKESISKITNDKISIINIIDIKKKEFEKYKNQSGIRTNKKNEYSCYVVTSKGINVII